MRGLPGGMGERDRAEVHQTTPPEENSSHRSPAPHVHAYYVSYGDDLYQAMSLAIRCTVSLFLPVLVSWYGVRRRSLSVSGGIVAAVVGAILTAASGCFCLALLAFFLTSSRLTKWKSAEKKRLEYDHKEGVYCVLVPPSV